MIMKVLIILMICLSSFNYSIVNAYDPDTVHLKINEYAARKSVADEKIKKNLFIGGLDEKILGAEIICKNQGLSGQSVPL